MLIKIQILYQKVFILGSSFKQLLLDSQSAIDKKSTNHAIVDRFMDLNLSEYHKNIVDILELLFLFFFLLYEIGILLELKNPG
jgi:hypothetical protein